ncbi:TolB-like protein [Bradyrhizobium sp. cir1]|uniref:winged helix-turn-helix domain-containing tetratricopeptide repeat protein n=1 Tax=Bradyrhizobium sp. cir1 TaxID=1445730 RepID=UPI001605E0A8|nr:winged helix-turn-helix domain-containing protein [Bradyrhizobium sp. cir1]MBB4370315.1 TolB-like protein [Bradyrhizobium sp. cir1]
MTNAYIFGPFRIDAEGDVLFRGAERLGAGRRAVAVLRVLLENHGAPVSKDTLIAAAWAGLSVEENNLSVQIAALRRELALEPGAELWIETLARRGYRYIGPPPLSESFGASVGAESRTALALPDGPSIAVLPFQNLSDDQQQDYFADGIVEEIITALSRVRWLFVIARNSSFIYKGRSVGVKQVGRELGVRYVLEGSVRKSGKRLRLSGQLVDSSNDVTLWADRIEGDVTDVFDLQDQLAASVVGAIRPRLERAEIERAGHKPTDSLQAYDHYLRGLAGINRATKGGTSDALQALYRAIELDPDYSSAYGMGAWCYGWRQANGWMLDRTKESAEALRLATLATELGKDDAIALARGGLILAYTGAQLENGRAFIERSLELDPNHAAAWHFRGWVCVYLGEPEQAIEDQSRAMRLSPFDPLRGNMSAAAAYAHLFAGRYEVAIALAFDALRLQPHFLAGLRAGAASNALAGRLDEAAAMVGRLREADPLHTISNLSERIPLRRPQDLATLKQGLRLAGLPD